MRKITIQAMLIFIFFCINTYSGQWLKVNDNINYYYNGLECLDSNNAAVLLQYGEDAFVEVTSDGGNSWITKMQDTGNTHWPYSYEYSFGKLLKKGYLAVLDSGDYWVSYDYGSSWEHKRYRDSNYKIFRSDVKFINESNGAILEPENLFITNDGGLSWVNISKEIIDVNIKSGFLLSLSIPYDNSIVILAVKIKVLFQDDSTYILRSDDFGKTWKSYPVIADFNNRLNSIFFIDSLRGWAVGMPKQNTNIRRDVIKYTSDGGYSWEYQLDTIMGEQPGGLFQVKFYDDSNGVAIGPWFHMWKTTNAGMNWFVDTSYHSNYTGGEIEWYFNHISYLTKYYLLATDALNGGIYKYYYVPVGISEDFNYSHKDIIISPNPASDYIEINLGRWTPSVRWSPSDLTVYNSLGECVINESIHPMTSSHRMNIEHLPPGLYLISINNGKELQTASFIVLR